MFEVGRWLSLSAKVLNWLRKLQLWTAAIKKICDIYDWDGKGVLDMYFFGDIIYALGMNITKKICVGLGQQVNCHKPSLAV